MAFEILKNESIWEPGDWVWILPDKRHSCWAQKLDWYLNFQVHRLHEKPSIELSPALVQTIQSEELPIPTQASPTQGAGPLMVASENLLPNRMTVILPVGEKGDVASWAQQAKKIATDLGASSARVFVPDGGEAAVIGKSWGATGPGLNLVEAQVKT